MCVFGFYIQDGSSGEKQDQAAGENKPKVKVKSIDLPIAANNIRQLDADVLNNFVEYEVSPADLWKSTDMFVIVCFIYFCKLQWKVM